MELEFRSPPILVFLSSSLCDLRPRFNTIDMNRPAGFTTTILSVVNPKVTPDRFITSGHSTSLLTCLGPPASFPAFITTTHAPPLVSTRELTTGGVRVYICRSFTEVPDPVSYVRSLEPVDRDMFLPLPYPDSAPHSHSIATSRRSQSHQCQYGRECSSKFVTPGC